MISRREWLQRTLAAGGLLALGSAVTAITPAISRPSNMADNWAARWAGCRMRP